MADALEITPQQVKFLETFGFLKLPGLFADDIAEIEQAFEAVWADEANARMDVDVDLHRRDPRTIIPLFVDKHPRLTALRDDPRIRGVVDALMPGGYEWAESDGNLASCNSEWHADVYGAPLDRRHVKLSFYLDRLRADSGAIRIIPGTNHWDEPFAKQLRADFHKYGQLEEIYGVDGEHIPCVILDSDPGDVLVWEYRTLHASYGGQERRRFFSLNFRELVKGGVDDAERQPVGAGR